MLKTKTIFLCQTCSFESPKWIGKCPSCQSWNTFSEENKITGSGKSTLTKLSSSKISKRSEPLSQIPRQNKRLLTQFPDFNDLLGGGIKSGSLVLLSGEPGIGKSTLTLQLCQGISMNTEKILYISGEESTEQIADRANRLKIDSEKISILNESVLEKIIDQIEKNPPDFVVIDSIQVLNSLELNSITGSINQVRFCTEKIMEIAKTKNITFLIIGHVTKDGTLAGPRALEHLVDTVLFFEGERYQNIRILRSFKNRFGSTNEIAIFEMDQNGLHEILSPSEIFLHGRQKNSIGSALTITIEGGKPIILEIQALSSPTIFGYPKRSSTGIDYNRLQMLSAVIQKFLKLNLVSQDIYLNVIGGLKLIEPANDLACTVAIISSFKKIPLPEKAAFIGEIGLTGEIRNTVFLNKRIKEAEKLGLEQIYIPIQNHKLLSNKIAIIEVQNLEQINKLLL